MGFFIQSSEIGRWRPNKGKNDLHQPPKEFGVFLSENEPMVDWNEYLFYFHTRGKILLLISYKFSVKLC